MVLSADNPNTAPLLFHERLKSHTMAAHKSLENLSLSRAIMSERLHLKEYAAYLNAMLAVVLQTENDIFPKVSDHFSRLDNRRKSHLIIKDLKVINHSICAQDKPFGDLSGCSEPFSSGILYVVEGSVLGGRMILRNVKATLQLDEKNGASYFHGYGELTSASWKQFISELIAYEQQYQYADEIIAGANFAFEAIEKHMTEYNSL